MVVVVLIVAGAIAWFGAALLIDAWRGGQLDLAQRLAPYERSSIADEAQRWLDQADTR
jgi:hypothetical protein